MGRDMHSVLFLASLPPGLRAAAPEARSIEPLLAEILEATRAAFPNITLAADVFLPYLAERMPEDAPLRESLADVAATDLYLACACLQGDADAIATFDARYIRELSAALTHLDVPSASIDDIKQIVRRRLLVGDAGGEDRPPERPRLADYAGRGDLWSYVRVVALRSALGLLRRGKNEVSVRDEVLFDLPSCADDPELSHLKEHYRTEFRAVFSEALSSLTSRQRNLLRQHYVHELTIDQIGAMYRVHRATAARWISAARQALLTGTRRRLMARLSVGHAEIESIMRLIRSHLDLSISRFLSNSKQL